jgi:hypothetical protein
LVAYGIELGLCHFVELKQAIDSMLQTELSRLALLDGQNPITKPRGKLPIPACHDTEELEFKAEAIYDD